MTRQRVRFSILAADLLWFPVALALACGVPLNAFTNLSLPLPFGFSRLLVAGVFVCLFLFSISSHLDGFQLGSRLTLAASWLVIADGILVASILSVAAILNVLIPTFVLLKVAFLLYAGFLVIRVVARWVLVASGRNHRFAIMGDGRVARELAAKLSAHTEICAEVVGVFTSAGQIDRLAIPEETRGISTLSVVDVLKKNEITDFVVVVPEPASREIASLVARCRAESIEVRLVPQCYDLYMTRPHLVEVEGIPLLCVDKRREHHLLLRVKPLLDALIALVLLAISSPVLLVAALELFMRKGQVIETESRCGRNGGIFSMHRLAISDKHPENSWFMSLLHKTSLSELPQLWNVFCGDMSIVGPRPETPDRIKHYSEWHRQRLSVKPGITGWAQVNGVRNEHAADEKTRFDLHYILNWSPLLDTVLMIQTVWTIFGRLHRRERTQNSVSYKLAAVFQIGSVYQHVDSTQPSAD